MVVAIGSWWLQLSFWPYALFLWATPKGNSFHYLDRHEARWISSRCQRSSSSSSSRTHGKASVAGVNCKNRWCTSSVVIFMRLLCTLDWVTRWVPVKECFDKCVRMGLAEEMDFSNQYPGWIYESLEKEGITTSNFEIIWDLSRQGQIISSL